MHISDGEDYYEYTLKSCRPKDPQSDRIKFLQDRVEELEAENAGLRQQLGIKKKVFNPHLGTMCEE